MLRHLRISKTFAMILSTRANGLSDVDAASVTMRLGWLTKVRSARTYVVASPNGFAHSLLVNGGT